MTADPAFVAAPAVEPAAAPIIMPTPAFVAGPIITTMPALIFPRRNGLYALETLQREAKSTREVFEDTLGFEGQEEVRYLTKATENMIEGLKFATTQFKFLREKLKKCAKSPALRGSSKPSKTRGRFVGDVFKAIDFVDVDC